MNLGDTYCPACGALCNAASVADRRGEAHPKEGDVSVCLYCQAVSIFRADLSLREPTEKEWDEIRRYAPNLEVYRAAAHQVVEEVRAAGVKLKGTASE
jgi:hypothetical protein